MSYYSKEHQKILYEEGDEIDFEFLAYPGPREYCRRAKVVKCLSPTFYEIEYEFQGETRRKQIIRSHLV